MAMSCINMFKDPRDGQEYKVVQIGNRIWFAENLRFKSDTSLVYEDNPDYEKQYGRLYHFDDLSDLAPDGWRIPTKEDFLSLEDCIDGFKNFNPISQKQILSMALRVPRAWRLGGIDKEGVDALGFACLPAGDFENGAFGNLGSKASIWSNSRSEYDGDSQSAYALEMNGMFAGVSLRNLNGAYSVRCVKDA